MSNVRKRSEAKILSDVRASNRELRTIGKKAYDAKVKKSKKAIKA